ncbi:MAG: hypothetical protein HY681_09765 [Chloroflexi bacterium]|nr:hypothetical protein [Chloroflexota bacterium]
MRILWHMPGVVGVFVGGCIARGEGSSFRARAHAHNSTKDPWYGWVCIRSARRLGDTAPCDDPAWDAIVVKPSRVLWHEYAHILTPNHWHDDAWRQAMRDLRQPIPARYAKKPRPVRRST